MFKKHLYLYFNKKYKVLLQRIEQKIHTSSFYVKFIDNISNYNSYYNIIQRYKYYNILYPYTILTQKKTYPKWMNKPLNFLFTNSHKIVLFIIFIFECYFNNCTLHIIFYYLLFYFFIEIYFIIFR